MLLLKKYSIQLLVTVSFSFLFCWFGYTITRDEEVPLFLFFGLVFVFYFFMGYKLSKHQLWLKTKHIFLIAILIRFSLVLMTPNLSDDFYRFYWDGHVILDGENPYQQIPAAYVINSREMQEVKAQCFSTTISHFPDGMNSKYYYSVYPPMSQLVFTFAASIAGSSLIGNIICIRIILILFECLALFMFIRILEKLSMNSNRVWIYALNPLVIIEITGNLHFEGLTISLLLCAFYLILMGKKLISGILYGMAICTKLIPLLFVPLMFSFTKIRTYILFLMGVFSAFFCCFYHFQIQILSQLLGRVSVFILTVSNSMRVYITFLGG